MDKNKFYNTLSELIRPDFNRFKPQKLEIWHDKIKHHKWSAPYPGTYKSTDDPIEHIADEIDLNHRAASFPIIVRVNDDRYYLWEDFQVSGIKDDNLKITAYCSRKKKSSKNIAKFLTHNNTLVRDVARLISAGAAPQITKEYEEFDFFTGSRDLEKYLEKHFSERFTYHHTGKYLYCTNDSYKIMFPFNHQKDKKSEFIKNFDSLFKAIPRLEIPAAFKISLAFYFKSKWTSDKFCYCSLQGASNYWHWGNFKNRYRYNFGNLYSRKKINITNGYSKLEKKIASEIEIAKFYTKHSKLFSKLTEVFYRFDFSIRGLFRRKKETLFYRKESDFTYHQIEVTRDNLAKELETLIQNQ